MRLQLLGQEDPLKEEMATHSSILAWRIPLTEEPVGLESRGLQSDTTEVCVHASANREFYFFLFNTNIFYLFSLPNYSG